MPVALRKAPESDGGELRMRMIKLPGGHQSLDKPFISYYCALTESVPLGKNDLSQPRLRATQRRIATQSPHLLGANGNLPPHIVWSTNIFKKVTPGLFPTGLALFCRILCLNTSLFAPVNNCGWEELPPLYAPRRERDPLIGRFRSLGARRRTDSTVLGRARGKRMIGQPSYPNAVRS